MLAKIISSTLLGVDACPIEVEVDLRKVFHMCWPLSETSSKRITIDEKPNHQVMHLFRLGKANRAAY